MKHRNADTFSNGMQMLQITASQMSNCNERPPTPRNYLSSHLIREFIGKSMAPPDILKPKYQMIESNNLDMEMSYKHPDEFLFDNENDANRYEYGSCLKNQKLFTRTLSNNSDDNAEKIWYYQPSVSESKDNFQVNKINYFDPDIQSESEASAGGEENDEDFFDSIDGFNRTRGHVSIYDIQETGEEDFAELNSSEYYDYGSWSIGSDTN